MQHLRSSLGEVYRSQIVLSAVQTIQDLASLRIGFIKLMHFSIQ